MKKVEVSVIVVAAGKGKRMERTYNKQYISLEGKPILAHTLMQFEKHGEIDGVIVVVGRGEVNFCKEHIIEKYNLQKVKRVVEGGKERYHSVSNGLKELGVETEVVMIHDGARPFVTEAIINKSIDAARIHGSAIVGVPVKDTIKTVDKDGFVKDTLKRDTLWSIQTPQTFKKDLIIQAHQKRKRENLSVTDDAMLVEALGMKVKMVLGSYENMKITTPEDLEVGQAIVKKRRKIE